MLERAGTKERSITRDRSAEQDDDADGFAQAAFRFCSGGHTHRFPSSRHGPRAVAEHFPYANRYSLRVKEMVLILIVRANSGANLNSLWLKLPRGF
jgi:hypothetical protein